MSSDLPKLPLSEATPIITAELRDTDIFKTADPDYEIPDVTLVPIDFGTANENLSNFKQLTIQEQAGRVIGSLYLVQSPRAAWLGKPELFEAYRGQYFGLATYLGVIGALHSVNRTLRSDPQGLSPDSDRVWRLLVRREIAAPLDKNQYDNQGNPRYISKLF